MSDPKKSFRPPPSPPVIKIWVEPPGTGLSRTKGLLNWIELNCTVLGKLSLILPVTKMFHRKLGQSASPKQSFQTVIWHNTNHVSNVTLIWLIQELCLKEALFSVGNWQVFSLSLWQLTLTQKMVTARVWLWYLNVMIRASKKLDQVNPSTPTHNILSFNDLQGLIQSGFCWCLSRSWGYREWF